MKTSTTCIASLASILCFANCADMHKVDGTEPVGSSSKELVVNCPFPKPAQPIFLDREMIIRSREVVDDPCRTTWNASCPSDRIGKWTFGRLMAVMSGATDQPGVPAETSAKARKFVANWLKFWLSDQTVGQDPNPVLARGRFRSQFLDPWLTASGCTAGSDPALCTSLDLKTNAPFRLLAIVNRIDMAGFNYATGQQTSPGELRFVFGALNLNAIADKSISAVVILEYKLPTKKSDWQWATMFHALSNISLGDLPTAAPNSTQFANQLQSITNLVTEPNAQPGKPNNGSSIGQVRTNEGAFDSNTGSARRWEFRQFTLPCSSDSCELKQVPVSQTPPTVRNKTQEITDFFIANRAALSNSTHVVPVDLLGGSSLSTSGVGAVVWKPMNPVATTDPAQDALVRHNFGFATCNGCHYLETGNQQLFFHIGPRELNTRSPISPFIGSSGALDSPDGIVAADRIVVNDPDLDAFDPGTDQSYKFVYNEPWRRACEIRRILSDPNSFHPPFSTGTGHSFLKTSSGY